MSIELAIKTAREFIRASHPDNLPPVYYRGGVDPLPEVREKNRRHVEAVINRYIRAISYLPVVGMGKGEGLSSMTVDALEEGLLRGTIPSSQVYLAFHIFIIKMTKRHSGCPIGVLLGDLPEWKLFRKGMVEFSS